MADYKLELPTGVPPLTMYYVYLTGGCNLACRHCWLSPAYQANGGTGGHLDYDLLALAIEEGLPLGLKSVKLTGGEPLLHPDFIRIIDLLREKDLSLTIETNGTLLTKSLVSYLKEKSTLDFISVSLDGTTPDSHDSFRGVKGSFDKTCQAVRYLVEVGHSPQIIMSLHAGNLHEIEAMARMAEGIGARSVKFNLIQPTGRGETMTNRGQIPSIHQLIQTGQWIEQDLQKLVSIPLLYSWPMAFMGIKRLMKNAKSGCQIFNILGILSGGQLAMCGIGVQEQELVYGQLGKDVIKSVWVNHPALKILRNMLPSKLEGICGVCLMRKRCLGYCVAENFHNSHNLTAPFWFCEQAQEVGLFPQARLANI
jgi:SynChlorMet cassette radical SAM/SPASM protein ScmF